ncbi:LysR substrate-binding domain-containing protein [Paraburkholderia tropica]|uniref:LysR substrate-binding domain-containing protein n=1 Tax=Paraburkholderia tropica TaxID=92647 RepID=UPI002AB68022|nr:LysR substrate-binding domain-containing protein [Paraburkholderia tropica]
MKIENASLQILVAAIEEGSLARAAERVHIVTSAASKRLSELERSVGTMLLVRHNQGVTPTAAGGVLYHKARAILRDVASLEALCASFAPDGLPKIRLAANRSSIVQFLPRDLRTFRATFGEARIDLVEAYSIDVPRMVSDQIVDIGIYHAATPVPGVVSMPYRHDRVVLVTAADHPLAGQTSVALDDARDFDFLGYFPRHSFEAFMELAGGGLTGTLNVKIQVASYEARCRMVAEGLGIAVLPEGIADSYVRLLGLAKILLKDAWAMRQIFVCTRAQREMRPAANTLFDWFANGQLNPGDGS